MINIQALCLQIFVKKGGYDFQTFGVSNSYLCYQLFLIVTQKLLQFKQLYVKLFETPKIIKQLVSGAANFFFMGSSRTCYSTSAELYRGSYINHARVWLRCKNSVFFVFVF